MIYRTQHYLETGELLEEPHPAEKIDTAKLHLDRLIRLKGEKIGCLEFRQHAAYYLKGAPRATKTRLAVNKATTQNEMNEILDEYVLIVNEKGLVG